MKYSYVLLLLFYYYFTGSEWLSGFVLRCLDLNYAHYCFCTISANVNTGKKADKFLVLL